MRGENLNRMAGPESERRDRSTRDALMDAALDLLEERGVLADTAKRRQDNVGWKIVTDAGSGARLGIPTKLAPQQSSDATGARWSSSTGTIQIQLARRDRPGVNLPHCTPKRRTI